MPVPIIVAALETTGAALDAAVRDGARGVVVAATGSGNTHPDLLRAAVDARDAGVAVVLASRTGAGAVGPGLRVPGRRGDLGARRDPPRGGPDARAGARRARPGPRRGDGRPDLAALLLGPGRLLIAAAAPAGYPCPTRPATEDRRDVVARGRPQAGPEQRLETVSWGLFLIMLGGFALVKDVPEGTWLIGAGLIMLGLNAVRLLVGIRASWFTIILGTIALLSGLGSVLGDRHPGRPAS